jgi:hypothetical protein
MSDKQRQINILILSMLYELIVESIDTNFPEQMVRRQTLLDKCSKIIEELNTPKEQK